MQRNGEGIWPGVLKEAAHEYSAGCISKTQNAESKFFDSGSEDSAGK